MEKLTEKEIEWIRYIERDEVPEDIKKILDNLKRCFESAMGYCDDISLEIENRSAVPDELNYLVHDWVGNKYHQCGTHYGDRNDELMNWLIELADWKHLLENYSDNPDDFCIVCKRTEMTV